MRVLAISGSLRKGSTNTAALDALASLAPPHMRVLVYQDLAKLPPYNPDDDLEHGSLPQVVEALRAMIGACDAVVMAVPEYAHSVPGVFKNALDWLVASEVFAGKKVVLINSSPRAYHAQANLREILATMSARFLADAFVNLPLTGQTLTAETIAADPTCARRLGHVIDALVEDAREG